MGGMGSWGGGELVGWDGWLEGKSGGDGRLEGELSGWDGWLEDGWDDWGGG